MKKMRYCNIIKYNKGAFLWTFLLSLILIGSASAQEIKEKKVKIVSVNLKVTDENSIVLPNAQIIVGEGLIHAETDTNGSFSFEARSNEIVSITLMGYEKEVTSVSVLVDNGRVVLKKSILYKTNEDIIPLPYNTGYRRTTTGAYNTLYSSQLEKYPSNDIRNVFVGLVPGLRVEEREGATGLSAEESNGAYHISSKVDLYVRGFNPIYIVDDVPVDITQMPLDPQEIESVTVVNDVIGKAMYGSEAANGIIFIKTKRGSKNERIMNVNMEKGLSAIDRFPEWVSGSDYARLNNMARTNSGLLPLYSDEQIAGYDKNDAYNKVTPNSNYRDLMLKNTKSYSKMNIASNGGNDVVQYFAYLGYSGEGDIYKLGEPADYNRLNARSNIDVKVNDFVKLKFDFFGGISLRRSPNYGYNSNYTNEDGGVNTALDIQEFNSVVSDITSIPPIAFPVYAAIDEESGLPWYGVNPAYKSNPIGNLVDNGYYTEKGRTGSANVALEYDLSSLLKGLTSKSYIGFNLFNMTRIGKTENYIAYIPTASQQFDENGNPVLDANGEKVYDIALTKVQDGIQMSNLAKLHDYYSQRLSGYQTFSYKRSFGVHDVQTSLTYTISKYLEDRTEEPRRQQNAIWTGLYTFNNKYTVEAVMSYNGASSFAPGNRYRLFPSIGASWVVSEENFMQKTSGWIDFLKLRAEYGEIGYDNLLNSNLYYMYNDRWTANNSGSVFGPHTANRWFGSTIDSDRSYRTTYNRIGNPNLTWETRKELSVGLDALMFKNKLSLQATYFNILRDETVVRIDNTFPLVAGYLANPYYNFAQTRHQGLELGLQYLDKIGREFKYSLGFNLATLSTDRIKMDEIPYKYDYQRRTGTPADAMFGLVYLGRFESDEAANKIPQLFDEKLSAGDLQYADLNQDGVVDNNDQTQIGNSTPKLIFGLNLTMSYKRFDLTVIGNGRAFVDVALTNRYFQNGWDDNTYSKFVKDNIGGDYPKLTYQKINNNFQFSKFWMRDGSFLKIQNVELAYNLKLSPGNGVGLRGSRIFVRGSNLLTLSGIKDVDPESMDSGVTKYPLYRTFTAGVKLTF
ncbi:MAG: SusC/RagA family TonB-linked outer membrane protein [Prolixibacteraceae bacterium]|jgi:TonB-linked SusC/RagA family outer membrane protein